MILRLICPSGHVLDVDAQLAGRKIRCGACGKIMVVPAPGATRAAAKPSVRAQPRTTPAGFADGPPPVAAPPKIPVAPPPAQPLVAESPMKPAPAELPAQPAAELPPQPAVELPAPIAPEPLPPEAVYVPPPALAELPLQLTVELPPTENYPQPTAELPPPTESEPSLPTIEVSLPMLAELPPPATFDVCPPAPAELPPPTSGSPPAIPAEAPSPQAAEFPLAPWTIAMPEPAMLALPPPAAKAKSPPADGRLHDTPRAPEKGREPTRFAGAPPAELEHAYDEAITLRRSLSAEFFCWLGNILPARPAHLPADAIEPSWTERRTAAGLAATVAATALLGLLPVLLLGHVNLPAAPPWALCAVLLAVVQLVYASWMFNAPDWASARVQMIVAAAMTTIYAMVMTLLLKTPDTRQLILGLDEVRHMALAPVWCGLMFVVMAAVTWHCGHTAARWRKEMEEDGPRQGFAGE
jgi:hypothetical protein